MGASLGARVTDIGKGLLAQATYGKATMQRLMYLCSIALLVAGCVSKASTGNLGIVMKNSVDSEVLLKSGRPYREIGPAEGQACRYFPLFLIPWVGKSDFSTAVDEALTATGGDALVNVSASSDLGVSSIFAFYSSSCTTVKGVAIKFE